MLGTWLVSLYFLNDPAESKTWLFHLEMDYDDLI